MEAYRHHAGGRHEGNQGLPADPVRGSQGRAQPVQPDHEDHAEDGVENTYHDEIEGTLLARHGGPQGPERVNACRAGPQENLSGDLPDGRPTGPDMFHDTLAEAAGGSGAGSSRIIRAIASSSFQRESSPSASGEGPCPSISPIIFSIF